ncbi:MAG: hypothetical protein AMK69_22700 [Nitrospira bacterium SG8_3]|nr:MAG: hypothetical protein AMK69_22700 [Nitrospira bacterium SG8_3]
MKQVTENVHVETGIFACNLGLITTTAGNVLIDAPHFPTDAVKWKEEVSKKGEVKYLINTEEHPDHTDCSKFMPGIFIAHENTREKLARIPPSEVLERVKQADPEGVPLAQECPPRLPDITFSENMNLYLGALTIKIFHLPGHSDGGTCVYIPEEKVVFTTDIIFHRKKSWLHEATPSYWLESLKKISKLDVDVIVPGHGEVCTKAYLEEQSDIIQKWVEVVRSAIDQGLSEEEAMTKITAPDPYPKQPNTPMTEEELNRAIISRLYQIYS